MKKLSQKLIFKTSIGTAIVSGSRDDTARLWCESTKAKWEASTIYKGHTRYVSSVAYREPDETYNKV